MLSADLLNQPVRLIAGPGAGKTQALVDLYVELVESGRAGRGEILVLTFSTAAAGEIAQRLDERLHDSYDEAWASTFHSFCARILREHRPDPGRLLMSGFQEWVAMRDTLANLDSATAFGALNRVLRSDAFAQDALAFVALLKQNRIHHSELSLLAQASGTPRLVALAEVYRAYQARLDAAGLRDFRDLIADAIAMLEALPQVLGRYQRKFRYVLVDEFQDIDPAQFYLLRLLVPPGAAIGGLLVAGDPDQSIYGFRGTVPRLLAEDFARVYGGRSVGLQQSHRCPPEALAAGQRLLEETQPTREPKEFGSARPGNPGAVTIARRSTTVDEAAFVAREIRRRLLECPGLRPGDFAVLLRSTTTLAAPFEEAIRALGLPYEVRGMGALARNEVVRFLLTYLHAIAQPDDPSSLDRLLASGLSGVGPRTSSRLRRYAIEEGRAFTKVVRRLMITDEELPDFATFMTEAELGSLREAVAVYDRIAKRAGHLPVAALAYAILMEAGVMERVLHLPLTEEERRESLAQLRAAMDAFTELDEVWRRLHQETPPLVADVAPRLESFIARAVDDAAPAEAGRDAVQVMTVHQAKGLQFDTVFLSGFAQGLFPLPARPHPLLEEDDQRWLERSLPGFRPSWPSNPEEHLAEEARLAYVGVTRASARLWITHADAYDGVAGPSPFLELALAEAPQNDPERQLSERTLLTLAEAETLLAGAKLSEPEQDRLSALGVDLEFVADPAAGRAFEPQLFPPEQVEVDHFSPTTLNDYLKCPRLYWYNHHPGLVAPPRGVEMERGSFLHQVLEDFHSREAEWRPLPIPEQRAWLEDALNTHLETYLNRVDSVLDRRSEEQVVRRILENYIRFATSSQPIRRLGTLMVERKFKIWLEGAEVRGKIDRVNDTGAGTCEVVDYKTGRGRTAQNAYEDYFGQDLSDVQLIMYYWACREGVDEEGQPLGLDPRFLSLWYPKDTVYGNMRQVLFPLDGSQPGVRDWMQRPVAADDLQRGRALATDAIRRIKSGDFAPAPRNKVGTCLTWFGCPHAQVCPYGGHPPE